MILVLLCACAVSGAPFYGNDGGYEGYASYLPLKLNSLTRPEDSLRAEAGSPDISRRPVRGGASDVPLVQGNSIAQEPPKAAPLYGQQSGGYKLADVYRNEHIDHSYEKDYVSNPQPYEYGYALKDAYGNSQHKSESSDGHGKVEGSYGFMDEHGLYRSVQYVADKEGFRATIKTNEPGTESQDPADVKVDSVA